MINDKRVLITDHVHQILLKGLSDLGWECDYLPEIKLEEVAERIEGYEGIIVNSKIIVDRAFIDRAKRLKFIARLGSGMDAIDQSYAEKKSIVCLNAPEGNRDAVAEQALGMLLSLLHNINKADAEVRKRQWLRQANRGIELRGKVIGIIGYGNTGQAFAQILKGFSVDIIAYDKYKKGFGNLYVREGVLQDIFKEADIVSMHVPLTEETNGMVDGQFLDNFKKSIFFINTARGKIVKTTELLKKIKEKKVLGAALDVLENEQINSLSAKERKWFDQLIVSNKVILTPHIAGWSQESKKKIAEVLMKKISLNIEH